MIDSGTQLGLTEIGSVPGPTDLQEIGITLELNPVEIAVWADKAGTDGIPVTMLYFAPDHTDPSQYIQYFGMIEGSVAKARARPTRCSA